MRQYIPDRWRVTFEDGQQETLYHCGDGLSAEKAVALCWPGRKFKRLEPAGDFNTGTGLFSYEKVVPFDRKRF